MILLTLRRFGAALPIEGCAFAGQLHGWLENEPVQVMLELR